MQCRRNVWFTGTLVSSALLAFALAAMGVVTGAGAGTAYAATNYWVAPTGADTNAGTQTAPFKPSRRPSTSPSRA